MTFAAFYAEAQNKIPERVRFETWENYAVDSDLTELGWTVAGGVSITSADQAKHSQSLVVEASGEATIPFRENESATVFVDAYYRPGVAETPFLIADTAAIGFVADGADAGVVAVWANSAWLLTECRIPVDAAGHSKIWLRITARIDFLRERWDLYGNKRLLAADLPLSGAAQSLRELTFAGPVCVDELYVTGKNPMFDDADSDGMHDAYELAKGLDPGSHDRERDVNFDGMSNIADYAAHITGTNALERGTVTREVWTGIWGKRLVDLVQHATYPDNPTFSDALTSFATPVNWGWGYGARVHGYLHPPVTGDYVFWVSGDDQCALYLSDSEHPSGAVLIATVSDWTAALEWDKFQEQRSVAVHLEAGQVYYIEGLQKEAGGGDSLSVAWELEGVFERQAIGGTHLSPFQPAPLLLPRVELAVGAGPASSGYLPRQTFRLKADYFKRRWDAEVEVEWRQVSGLGVANIADPSALETTVALPAAGVYEFQVTAVDGYNLAVDNVEIALRQSLIEGVTGVTREVWLGVSGGGVDNLLSSEAYLQAPMVVDTLESFETPEPWADNYGQQLTALLVPPTTGTYRFFIASDDHSALFLSDSEDAAGLTQIAHLNIWTSYRNWDYRDSQASAEIELEAGRSYLIRAIHKDGGGHDYLTVGWQGPDIERQVIDSVFLMPYLDAPRATALPVAVAYAGDDQEVYCPQQETTLTAQVFAMSVEPELVTFRWTQIDGPTQAAIADQTGETTALTLPAEGEYVIRLDASIEGAVVHSDEVIVRLHRALAPNTGSILREVWTDVWYNEVQLLLNHENYPDNPYFRDLLPRLATPVHWSDGYGTRIRGYLHAPVSGQYRFAISGDDECQLLLGAGDDPATATLIAQVPGATSPEDWDRYEEQLSIWVELEAGERYYVEVLHKEGWGGDHVAVAWSTPWSPALSIVPGSMLSPWSREDAAPVDEAIKVFADAGPDREIYFPRSELALAGRIQFRRGQDGEPAVRWRQLSGPAGAGFLAASDPETTLTLQAPGVYELELTVTCDAASHRDTVMVTVLEPLNQAVGGILREVWLDVRGGSVEDLVEDERYPDSPTFSDHLSTFEGPSHWGYHYGTRVRGYVHPPATGEYTFYVSGDREATLLLSVTDSAADTAVVAFTDDWNSVRQIRTAAQESEPVTLQAGQRYYIELLHRETAGHDHFAVQWEGPALFEREVIQASFLEPFAAVQTRNEDILVIAGEDQDTYWPRNQLDFLGTVYDMVDGPESLTYLWSKAAGPGSVTFSDPAYPATSATFSEPGTYTLMLFATDGMNAAADEIDVLVREPLGPNAGSILREVWLDAYGARLTDVANAEGYPLEPTFSELMPALEGPLRFTEHYVARYRGYLHVPADGDYQFFIASDDHSSLSLGLDGTPASAQPVASVEGWVSYQNWTQRDSQYSEVLSLSAGQKIYLDVLHKQGWSSEHLAVAWQRQGADEEPVVIDGTFLAPFYDAPARENELLVVGGRDIDAHWPDHVRQLEGWVIDLYAGPLALAIEWSQVSGPAVVEFADSTDPQTVVRFPQPGSYVLRLSANDGLNVRTANVNVSIGDALAEGTGAILHEVWEQVGHYRLYSLLGDPSYPHEPTSRDLIGALETEVNRGDQYGQRLRGYLHVPEDGLYRFRIAGDDDAYFMLNAAGDSVDFWQQMSDTAVAYHVITAHVPGNTDIGEWDKYPSQYSAPAYLLKDSGYYVEVLHKEGWGDDHVTVQWLRPDRDTFEIVTGAFLSPYIPEGITMPELYVPEFVPVEPATDPIASVPPDADDADFPVPPVPEYSPSGTASDAELARFLNQATFGATPALISEVQTLGFEGWLNSQIAMPATLHLPVLDKTRELTDQGFIGVDNARERAFTWWTIAIDSQDQLRQRVAFALSEIVVISDHSSALSRRTRGVTNYYDILVRNAFGNYRQILEEVTLNPMMGIYLTMLRNAKANPVTGTLPDENYAREIMQLFSIGLNALNPDGSLKVDESGVPLETYSQDEILNFAKALTGWTFSGSTNFYWTSSDPRQELAPMMAFEEYHDTSEKVLLRGQVVPAGQTAYQDCQSVIDSVFQHPNVGPFIARRMIQRLVTSNPSPGYIYRVAQQFDDNGHGVRGDLSAVVRAILLDPEARSLEQAAKDTAGKVREPIVRLTQLVRAFRAAPTWNPPTFGRYTFDTSLADVMGQAPFYAKSVFNFFEPDYIPVGEAREQRVFAPEFQMINDLTAIDTANYFHQGIAYGLGTHWMHPSVYLDYSGYEALAAAPAILVDSLNVLLMDGDMSPEMQAEIAQTLAAISQDTDDQVIAVLQLIYSSPEYVIQK